MGGNDCGDSRHTFIVKSRSQFELRAAPVTALRVVAYLAAGLHARLHRRNDDPEISPLKAKHTHCGICRLTRAAFASLRFVRNVLCEPMIVRLDQLALKN